MDTDIDTIEAALAELSKGELHALIWAANNSLPVTRGLRVWLQAACTWEMHRRVGVNHKLESPSALIPHVEATTGIDAAHAIKSMFGMGRGRVAVLLDALITALHIIAIPRSVHEPASPHHSSRRTDGASNSR